MQIESTKLFNLFFLYKQFYFTSYHTSHVPNTATGGRVGCETEREIFSETYEKSTHLIKRES